MKKLIVILLSVCLVLSLAASASAATYEFKFSITQSATDPIAIYAQQMIDEIQEKTNNDVVIELHPNGELGAINDVNEMIAMGAKMINYTGSDAFTSTVPELAILNCQFCLSDPAQMAKVQESDWYKDQVEVLAKQGNVRLLTLNWFTGYRHFISKFPINTVDDLSGKQMRVADNAALPAFARALGASPVVTNWNETYTALSQGMVDCAEAPLSTLYNSSLQEVTQYLTLTGHLVSCGGICMNEGIFESMPEEYQKIFLEAAWNAGEAFKENSMGVEAEYTGKFEAAGLKITKIEGEAKEAFIKKASAMYADPALGFPQGLFEKIQEIIK